MKKVEIPADEISVAKQLANEKREVSRIDAILDSLPRGYRWNERPNTKIICALLESCKSLLKHRESILAIHSELEMSAFREKTSLQDRGENPHLLSAEKRRSSKRYPV
ncbi:MAG: hypothetical protein ABH871_08990 [Pseudomonadota bacterium]